MVTDEEERGKLVNWSN